MHDPLVPANKVAEDATKARLGAKRAWITRRRNAQARVTMKCLSVRQPWTDAIFLRGKDVENRTFRTNYRGPLLIQASRTFDREAPRKGELPDSYVIGAILGIVDLTDVVDNSPSSWAKPDHWHWLLDKPRLLAEPIACAGKLGIFEVEIPLGALKKAQTPNPKGENLVRKTGVRKAETIPNDPRPGALLDAEGKPLSAGKKAARTRKLRAAGRQAGKTRRLRVAARQEPERPVRWVESDETLDGLGHGVQFLHDELQRKHAVAFLEGFDWLHRRGSSATVRLLSIRPTSITADHWSRSLRQPVKPSACFYRTKAISSRRSATDRSTS
jgi:hypothetical protein